MTTFSFDKMHALGNDFVVIDGINQIINSELLPLPLLSHRHLGIGFDQLLLLEKSPNADFLCRIFNADGSEAEQCGNGLRCAARFAKNKKLVTTDAFTISTKAGCYSVHISAEDVISVNMGVPNFAPLEILKVNDEFPAVEITVLSIGNPHAIFQVTSIEDAPIDTLGPLIATHQAFSRGINVGFMEIIERGRIRLKTFERGVGKTYACGSNACAAVIAGIRNGMLDRKVIVELPYGELLIQWPSATDEINMSGPTTHVFTGELVLEDL